MWVSKQKYEQKLKEDFATGRAQGQYRGQAVERTHMLEALRLQIKDLRESFSLSVYVFGYFLISNALNILIL